MKRPAAAILAAALCLCLGLGAVANAASSLGDVKANRRQPLEAGPLVHEFKLTLEPGTRQEVLGPLFGSQETEDGLRWAFAPFVSYERVESTDWEQFDFLYPFLNYHRVGPESRLQLFQLFSIAGGGLTDTNQARRVTLYPLYFQQRASLPSNNYTAILPFYGRLKNRFNRDELLVAGFPLYLQSRKRGVVTDNFFFPFLHWRHGGGVQGWQFLPLAGHEQRQIGSATNIYGETVTLPGHKKWFALWPFFSGDQKELGTPTAQTNWAALPFAYQHHSAQRDRESWLWPFFNFTDDREKQFKEWSAPWPFLGASHGPGKESLRLWPVYGHGKKPGLDVEFWLWPLYKHTAIDSPPLQRERTRLLFLAYTDIIERNLTAGTEKRRRDLWPIFTDRRGFDGTRRLQIGALIEPMLAYNRAVERNWSPLWSVWRQEWNPAAGTASKSLFWNFYREDTTPGGKKGSLLFGLIQYQNTPESSAWRWFGFSSSQHVSKRR